MESTIGARIRQLREAKRLSVAEFATAAGVKPSAIYGLESGANKPSIETVGNLRQSFPDLDTDWLLLGTGPMLRDGRTLTPASQLPPPVPSEARPLRVNRDDEDVPYWRGVASERLSRIEKLEQTVQWQQEQLGVLIKKPEASAEAADLRDETDAIWAEHCAEQEAKQYRIAAQVAYGAVQGRWVNLSVA